MRVFSPAEGAIAIELICDGPEHGLLPPDAALFGDDGIIEQIAAAMRAGWKETYTAAGDKRWLGPCCSGKKIA